MSSVRTRPRLTAEEYLAIERHAETKSEYLNGEMFPMTGGSFRHNVIVANLVGEIHPQLKGRPFTVVPSDLRVRVSATGLYTYPDVAVVSGAPVLEDREFDTLLNPTLIIEVLSPTTEAYDRGEEAQALRDDRLACRVRPRIPGHSAGRAARPAERRPLASRDHLGPRPEGRTVLHRVRAGTGGDLPEGSARVKHPLHNPLCRSKNPLRGRNNPC